MAPIHKNYAILAISLVFLETVRKNILKSLFFWKYKNKKAQSFQNLKKTEKMFLKTKFLIFCNQAALLQYKYPLSWNSQNKFLQLNCETTYFIHSFLNDETA